MLYKTVVDDTTTGSTGLAAKIFGDTPLGPASSVLWAWARSLPCAKILGGAHAGESLELSGVRVGSRLNLVQVSAAQVMSFAHHTPVVCSTRDGLRLYFHAKDAEGIHVSA